jgi:hypothetical protein
VDKGGSGLGSVPVRITEYWRFFYTCPLLFVAASPTTLVTCATVLCIVGRLAVSLVLNWAVRIGVLLLCIGYLRFSQRIVKYMFVGARGVVTLLRNSYSRFLLVKAMVGQCGAQPHSVLQFTGLAVCFCAFVLKCT